MSDKQTHYDRINELIRMREANRKMRNAVLWGLVYAVVLTAVLFGVLRWAGSRAIEKTDQIQRQGVGRIN